MRYSSLGGGKRLRPFLMVETARLFGVEGGACCAPPARSKWSIAIPSSTTTCRPWTTTTSARRPTCHKAFDEATAILAGDGLLTYAFDVLADPATHADPAVRADLVLGLARGSVSAAWSADRRSTSKPRRRPSRTKAALRHDHAVDEDWRAAALRREAGARIARASAARPLRSHLRPRALAHASRSPTIFSTPRATRRRWASAPARTPDATRRRWWLRSASTRRASVATGWRWRRSRRWKQAVSANAQTLAEAARFTAARRS